jgi:hypothetical protein
MYAETRKLNIIDEVLKIDSDALLSKIELMVKEARESKTGRSFADFAGSLTNDEASEMTSIIEASCETSGGS